MSHGGGIVVGIILAAVLLIIVLSLGRSIRRASRMNPGSPGHEPLDQDDHRGGHR
jgi:hypothetical protein